ncbi:hypothetical protein BCh11DRAFT_04580 [Burkholderia sp. Ch1-1]|uniref:Copper-binding protein n=2 Tax=Burkholderiaceae TaxID=119060 RepID=A0A5Q4ZK21_9BURK|nr:hypothetical protein BCh11DRAFT_04580 [Burkholderia sp. Ch1-1]VVD30588.1 conserved exported protein of unknown function [Paraburkholderia dioscoreae]
MTCSRKVRSWTAVMFGVVVLASVLAAHCQSTFAQDTDAHAGQQALARAELIHAQVRVVAINTATNSVTLRGPRGNLADVDVNPALADVSRLKIGDKLNVAYQQALLLNIDRLSTKGVRERVETTAAIPASAGYASSAHSVRVIATVLKIDRKSRMVTLRGPKHRQVLRAAKGISLDQLKVGDSVRAEFVSAAAVKLVRE